MWTWKKITHFGSQPGSKSDIHCISHQKKATYSEGWLWIPTISKADLLLCSYWLFTHGTRRQDIQCPPPKPTYHTLKVDVIRQLFSDYQHAPLIQRCVISFESGWNFQIYSLVSFLVDLLAHAPLSQIYSWVSLFIHDCLFTPKKSKNLLTSWVDFRS